MHSRIPLDPPKTMLKIWETFLNPLMPKNATEKTLTEFINNIIANLIFINWA